MKESEVLGAVVVEETPSFACAPKKAKDGRRRLGGPLKGRAHRSMAGTLRSWAGTRRLKDEGRLGIGEPPEGERTRERRKRRAWEQLLSWAKKYAWWRLSFVRWRGEEGGVAPEGFDAESVAMEAVLSVGREREAAGQEWARDRKAVGRAIRRLVDRLKHRREPWCTSSEPDLKRVVVDAGEKWEETVSPSEQMADAGPRPGQELVEWERINEFKKYLGGDEEAKRLVECYCGNVTRRQEIARLTGLGWREVKNARERLMGKWRAFKSREEALIEG